MGTPSPDWAGLGQAIAARRRPIMEGLADFLRLDTVSQKPDRRAGGSRVAHPGHAGPRARGPDHGDGG